MAGEWVRTARVTYACLGIGSVEAKVLCVLEGQAMTCAAAGRALGIDRSAVSRAVLALAGRGFIVRVESYRGMLILTPDGLEIQREAGRVAREREQRLLHSLSDLDRARLVGYLDRLAANVPELQVYAGALDRKRRR